MKTNAKRVFSLVLSLSLIFAMAMPSKTEAASLKTTTTKIVEKVTTKTDDNKTKLKKLAKYVESNAYGYERTKNFKNKKGWTQTFAKNFYSKKKGSCYGYAAGYAYLAKNATNLTVRVGVGKTNAFSGRFQPHAWTEVKIDGTWYICDTNVDKYKAKGKGTYILKKRSSLKKKYNKYKKVKYTTIKF